MRILYWWVPERNPYGLCDGVRYSVLEMRMVIARQRKAASSAQALVETSDAQQRNRMRLRVGLGRVLKILLLADGENALRTH